MWWNVWLLSIVSRLITSSHDQNNYSLFCDIDLVKQPRHMSWSLLWNFLVCSADVGVTAIASELAQEMWSRMWRPTRPTLVQFDPPGGWAEMNFCSWECAIYGWLEFLAHIIESTVSFEGQFDVCGFLQCFIGWITLQHMSTVGVNEFRWVAITNECYTKRAFMFREGFWHSNIISTRKITSY